jgi:hypothetical protein
MNRIILTVFLAGSLTGCGAVETIQTIHQRGRLDDAKEAYKQCVLAHKDDLNQCSAEKSILQAEISSSRNVNSLSN